jgi:diketogulonate reductase-like aldo/keto reductase
MEKDKNSMTISSPLIVLNNGVQMPGFGLGVYRSTPEQTMGAVEAALASGYRMIDTAAAYLNEQEVGEAIRRSGVARSELFIQTKLWISDYGYEQALRAFDVSLRKLGLDYIDQYLLHWPVPSDLEKTVASYKAAERLLAEGRVRAIGVCNFSTTHLAQLIDRTDVVPAVNQVELHPSFNQQELRDTHARLGVVTQAWSPIGGITRYSVAANAAQDPLARPVVADLARKYGKTPAQIVLRWHIEHGIAVIPKSVRPERIAENIDVFDFALEADEVAALDELETGMRGGPNPERVDGKTFKLSIPD